ncbi:hypothetical protein HDV03_000050 [Kappamyces sp. JEL0829]|nr:hypothetical protein HDV03_000050 [Kappamyces sp. JEL0829]
MLWTLIQIVVVLVLYQPFADTGTTAETFFFALHIVYAVVMAVGLKALFQISFPGVVLCGQTARLQPRSYLPVMSIASLLQVLVEVSYLYYLANVYMVEKIVVVVQAGLLVSSIGHSILILVLLHLLKQSEASYDDHRSSGHPSPWQEGHPEPLPIYSPKATLPDLDSPEPPTYSTSTSQPQ